MYIKWAAILQNKMADKTELAFSSSFSMPVGIWGTVLLIAAKSARSGMSSAWYIGSALVASNARALNDSFELMFKGGPKTAPEIWPGPLRHLKIPYFSRTDSNKYLYVLKLVYSLLLCPYSGAMYVKFQLICDAIFLSMLAGNHFLSGVRIL